MRPSTSRIASGLLLAVLFTTVSSVRAQSFGDTFNDQLYTNESYSSFDSSFQLEGDMQFDVNAELQRGGNPEESYRMCMQTAVRRREISLVQLYRQYYNQRMSAREALAQDLINVWSISDRRQRSRAESDAQRNYRDRVRDIEDWFDDVEDDIKDRYNDDRRSCDQLKRDLERRQRDQDRGRSYSSSSRRNSSSSVWWGPDWNSSSSWESIEDRMRRCQCEPICNPGEVCILLCRADNCTF